MLNFTIKSHFAAPVMDAAAVVAPVRESVITPAEALIDVVNDSIKVPVGDLITEAAVAPVRSNTPPEVLLTFTTTE